MRQEADATELTLRTADGLGLFAQEWRPDGLSTAVVCVVHGLGEHGGQYVEVAHALVGRGMALVAIDQRGHGRSEGKRGHTPSYDALLDDVDTLLATARQRHSGAAVFLYGHSLGGNIVLNHALRRQPAIAGVVATGPWLRLTNDIALWKRVLGTILEPFWPTMSFSTRTDRDEAIEELGSRRNVELFHEWITLRLLMSTRRAGFWAVRHADRLRVPTFLIHGSNDPVTDHRSSLEFQQRAGDFCQTLILPGVGHNPHEEDLVTIPKVVDWIANQARHL